jgi:hypothetical protein
MVRGPDDYLPQPDLTQGRATLTSVTSGFTQCSGCGSACFWAYPDPLVTLRIRIRILPFSNKGVEWTEIMVEKFNFNTKIVFLKI